MQEFFDSLLSSEVLGLGVAIVIFIITIALVLKRLIGLVLTLILLFIAIISGLVIANNHWVNNFLHREMPEKVAEGEGQPTTIKTLKRQIVDAYQELRTSVCTANIPQEAEPLPSEKVSASIPTADKALAEAIAEIHEKLDRQDQQLRKIFRELKSNTAAKSPPEKHIENL